MVKIITDTASDITLAQAQQMDVEIVSLGVQFGSTPYFQLEDETFEEFYRQLETSKELPVTSQPSPADFLVHFAKAKQQKDEVVVILLSGALSGTVQSALIAKNMAEYDKIHIIDSRSAIMGLRLLVEYAVKLRKEGKTAAEIADLVEKGTGRIKLYGALDTLKYLRKGGRIPKSTEVIGSVLGIKPLITLTAEGSIEMAGKARGHAGAVSMLIKKMDECPAFDPEVPVYFGYTKDAVPCHSFKKIAAARYKLTNIKQYPIGGLIGTHVGPGGLAVVYMEKE